MFEIGQWLYLKSLKTDCRVIGIDPSWDRVQYEVFLPSDGSVRIVAEDEVTALSEIHDIKLEPHRISYICAATKINQLFTDFAEKKSIVAPARASVLPLPHQIEALKKVMGSNPVRFLLADEVGLGKTIEAGLVIEEMKLRYQIGRILVLVPKSLASQWVSEMKIHFSEDFKLINGNDIEPLDRLFVSEGGAWKQFNQVIVTHGSVKPITRRRGWSMEKVDEYNSQRLGNLLKAGWDLIIVDEAHRFGGSTEQVARYKLGKSLSENTPNLLLLSATPHQGKSDAFFRLMNILDERAFPEENSISKDTVAPFLVRTEKRMAIDSDGRKLFKDRATALVPVSWGTAHTEHQLLYEQVSEYARNGYNKALKNKKPQMGFLMVLLQRLVSSSTAAIRNTLERRLSVLHEMEDSENQQGDIFTAEDMAEMTGEEQQEILIESNSGVLSETADVESLLDLARRCENTIDDAKAIALLNLVSRLMEEEDDYGLKVLIFTEFVATQDMLATLLEKRNFKVQRINGSMSADDRNKAMDHFREDSNFLISTDAGGEGLNLQFSHVVINYDLPWNPMKIEQRIGRVDRIGQSQTVRVFNLLLDSSVEYRIRQVLEYKLKVVAEELGIDKTDDVLESTDNGNTIEKALTESIMNPKAAEKFINRAVDEIKAESKEEMEIAGLLSAASSVPDKDSVKEFKDNPLPFLTERMVSQFVLSRGGEATRNKGKWIFRTTDGQVFRNIVFDSNEQGVYKSTKDSEVSGILSTIPVFHRDNPIPEVFIEGLPDGLCGTWGLFCLGVRNGLSDIKKEYLQLDGMSRFYFPVFLSSDGRVYKPTASRIWDIIQKTDIAVTGYDDPAASRRKYDDVHSAALQVAKEYYDGYLIKQETMVNRERQRLASFDIYQENNITKTGLQNIRQFRQQKLSLYNEAVDNEIKAYLDNRPNLQCFIVISIGGQG